MGFTSFIKEKKILGMPIIYSFIILIILIIGIVIGSFFDYDINVALANKTDIGNFFATYGSYFSYCLYPAAGMCIYKGLLAKDKKKYSFLAWVILAFSYFLAVYYSNSYNGSKVRELFGYSTSENKLLISCLAYLFWVVLYSWVPLVFYFILNDVNPKMLIGIGITILLAGVVSDCLNLWLKQVASRPRYKYLITLEDPKAAYKNWWEFNPNFAGSNDNFKSWPSGNMTIASYMFALPLLVSVVKKTNKVAVVISFAVACLFVILYGYNRIHMTNHFLTDVCFGTLFTYLVFAVTSFAFNKSLE